MFYSLYVGLYKTKSYTIGYYRQRFSGRIHDRIVLKQLKTYAPHKKV